MRIFRQIRSSFNDPDDKMFSCLFETMEDLLHYDFIRRNTVYHSFFRFSITEDNALMAEYSDGFRWWVVGRIDDPSNLGLPWWKAKYHALLNGQEVILVDEVISSCGDELTLRDGRKAKWLR
jgi:hypothetical protein